jgi:hypothetical protein
MSAIPGADSGVRTKHAGYKDALEQWKRCRDVIAGGDAIKAAKTKYLPILNDQDIRNYDAYLLRANFFNATSRTVAAMIGMLYRKPPRIEVPAVVEGYLDNVTMDGQKFDIFSREVAKELISVGRVGILVDHPPLVEKQTGPLTVADTEQLGLRPVMKCYTAENIFNWRVRNIDNRLVVCQIILQELFSEPVDEFEDKTENRYRVLDLQDDNTYRQRVFRIDEDTQQEIQVGPDIIPLMNGAPLTFIPFVFLCSDGDECDFNEPPILDLVDMNLSHYRTSADYEHACHFTALPMLYVAGMNTVDVNGQPAKVYLGSQSALILDNPQAKVGFIEFTGNGLGTLENNLDRKEQMMAVLGARMLQPQKKAVETAMTSAIHRTGENSILASLSIAISISMLKALQWFTNWSVNTNTAIDFEINRDFLPVAIDGPTLTAYVGAFQAGTLTEEEMFDLFQRADLIESEVDFADHKAQIDAKAAIDQQNQLDLITSAPVNPNAPDKSNVGTKPA